MYKLRNGVEIPEIAFGTWKITDPEVCRKSVKFALETGYRHIDTAMIYKNEEFVGKGIKEFLAENKNIKREDFFITTKVWNSDQGYDSTLAAFELSLKKLALDYVDLYLIHWPNTPNMKTTIDTWKALEKLYKDKKVRAIGVCNFEIHHFEELLPEAEIIPMIDQIELHPLNQQLKSRAYCKDKGIIVESWSPLMQGNLENDVIEKIGKVHGKTVAQVILKWHLQSGLLPLPKSVTPSRIKENKDLNFVLSNEEMDTINALNKEERFATHPDNMSSGFEKLR
ncbi:aldo/keto reductase [Fusobacterium varium]|uniref:Aldo/keto reductase n=2 Tax=Fusobacterium varium TaxID=856 RepID=A0ABN5JJ80_FUSVA|nr:aldo/keto reductase [Fusobacterium varium]AVQ31692.1 aldo/keto reductase [Fusobacterium varium ATCC 27725]EES63035.1 glyoxal reductase [Fusobacterium varium ATCC 27725]VEH39489.1 Glyoxal reductase [Fusobacterium varium]